MNTILYEWLDRHKISLLFGFSLVAFIKGGDGLRWFDFSAASIDIGILTVVALVVVLLLTFIMLTNLLIRHYWEGLDEFVESFFTETFNLLELWQKILFYTVFFFGLLWAFVVVLLAVM